MSKHFSVQSSPISEHYSVWKFPRVVRSSFFEEWNKTKIRLGHCRNDTDRGTSKCSEKNLSHCQLSPTTNLPRNAPGTNARFRGDWPAINCLNHATALYILDECSVHTSKKTYSIFIIKTDCWRPWGGNRCLFWQSWEYRVWAKTKICEYWT